MEERDVQVKGYRMRLPLDVLVVASANPEDYTSRGRIITPLKDRYEAQIRTHYPRTRELELAIVRQEARAAGGGRRRALRAALHGGDRRRAHLPGAPSPDVNQASGVSVRMSIANYETLLANAAAPRAARWASARRCRASPISRRCDASTCGKLELEYAGVERSEGDVIRELRQAREQVRVRRARAARCAGRGGRRFDQGWKVEVSAGDAVARVPRGSRPDRGLREAAQRLAGGDSSARLASAIEFLLEGLHLSNQLNKQVRENGALYARS